MSKLFLLLAALFVVVAGALLGWFFWQEESARLEIAGIYLIPPKPVADFTLTDGSGKPFTRTQLIGYWTFIYFGYTYCPDACPLAMGALKQVAGRLEEQHFDEATQYLMVSVDPQRDTPERLAEYVHYFNPEFRGVTGDPAELDKLARPLGVYYSVPDDPEDPENYPVEHSSAVILINPDAELQALFTPPLDSTRIAEDFIAISKRYQASH